MAEYVSRCGCTVQKHAFESCGDAVKEAVSSSSDFEAAHSNFVADSVATESLKCVRNCEVLRDSEVWKQVIFAELFTSVLR